MPQWFGEDTDWNDVRRIATGINAFKRVGAGHDPVSLDVYADTVLDIGIGDLPQEISLDKQAANTVFAGPVAGIDDYPTFRLLVAEDISGILPIPLNQNEMLIADATPEWALLAAPTAQYQRLETGANPFTPVWVNNLTMADDAWIGLGAGAGRIIFDSTPNPDQVQLAAADLYLPASHGIIHADGVVAGRILRADGTRYIPADPTLYMPLAPVAQGDIIIANATPAWSILSRGAAAGYALISTATTAEWDQTPTWTGDHTWDDGVGDSPAIVFVGGSHDDTARIYLDDSGTAGNSDLIIRLCATDHDSNLYVQDSAGNIVALIDADGNMGVGTATVPHGGVGWARFAIEGANAAAGGPHMQFTTATDNYPLIQILPLLHDGISIFFDAYYDGANKSSDAGSNFVLTKNSDKLQFRYESGIAAGNAITWATALSIDAATGHVSVGTTLTSGLLLVDQVDAAGATPTLHLTQRDVSEEIIRMTSSTTNAGVLVATLVDVNDVGSTTPVGYFRVYISDDNNKITDGPYYVEFCSLAP